MLLFDALRFTLTMSGISSLLATVALIGIQVFVQLLSVDGYTYRLSTTTTTTTTTTSTETPMNFTLNPDYDYDDDFFIVGGEDALEDEFPFMAALGWINDAGDLKFHGGGMVISPKMVLTAAHCVYKDGKLPDIVYIGGKNLSEIETNALLTKFWVVNATIYPQYDPHQGYDDIALLELNHSTIWSQRICLWPLENLNSSNVTAIGYGLTEFAGLGSQELMKVNLTVFPSDFCAPFFKRQRKFKFGISDAHMCAGDKNGKKDTCQGDSGGPLIVRYKNENLAVGVTSSGQACSGFPPAIYTKIYPYIEWITSVLEERGEILQKCVNSEFGNFSTIKE